MRFSSFSRNFCQFVYELNNLAGFSIFCAMGKISRMIGEWSDDRSKLEDTLHLFVSIPFTTKKSIRSGFLLESDGQYIGSPVEI